jgi:hypothetical protein
MEFIVYAAGPIEGCSYDGCTNWRAGLQEQFDSLVKTGDRIRVASPMRAKSYLKDQVVTRDLVNGLTDQYQKATSSPRAIMLRDHFDCTRADLVFVNFIGAPKVSIGTVMEVAWGFHKPVVIAMEPGNIHEHPMITEAGLVVPDFDLAVKDAANILLLNIDGIAENHEKPFVDYAAVLESIRESNRTGVMPA